MAKLIGNAPHDEKNSHGEYLFFQYLLEHLSDEVTITFNLNLVGVHEMDAVIAHPSLGNFIIEVKGHKISQLGSRINSGFEVIATPTSPTKKVIDPVGQARNQLFSFIQYFNARGYNAPYLFLAVAFPQITRGEWEDKFGCLDGEENFIFKDDLVDLESITQALDLNRKNPIQGVFPGERIATKSVDRNNLILAMNKKLNKPKIRSFEETKILHTKGIDSVPQNKEDKSPIKLLRISGDAGTGKTYKLIQWANNQASEGKRVLLTTFNNSLAAELRRLNSSNPDLNDLNGSVSILSFSELLIEVAQRLNFSLLPYTDYKSEADWIKRYKEVTHSNQLLHSNEKYDAIAIDEAQDIYDHVWDFIHLKTSSENTNWAMSFSKGQNLYVSDEELSKLKIMEWVRNHPTENIEDCYLSMPRRTISEASVIMQSFQNSKSKWGNETYWNSMKISRHRFKSELAEYIGKDKLERFIENNQTVLISSERSSYTVRLDEALDRMIQNLEILGEDAAEMIMFATANDSRIEFVKNYLKFKNVGFVDFVNTNFKDEIDFDRRLPLPPNLVRITTIHKARGIDASNAIVLGLEYDVFEPRRFKEDSSYRLNLWYVALTRSRFVTFLDADLTEIQTEYMLEPTLVSYSALAGHKDEILNGFLALVNFRKEHPQSLKPLDSPSSSDN